MQFEIYEKGEIREMSSEERFEVQEYFLNKELGKY